MVPLMSPEHQEVDSYDGPVLIQGYEGPILRGDFADGITYYCMHCRQTVLAVNVSKDQLWDFAMRCRKCARLTPMPALPAGMALPSREVIPIPDGQTTVPSELDVKNSFVVGGGGLRRRRDERTRKEILATKPLDAALMRFWVDTIRNLLGEERFQRLHARDLRSRSHATPLKKRHGLIRVVDELEKAVSTFDTGAPVVWGPAVFEAIALIRLLERWRNHPRHVTFVAALYEEYEHTLITLALASLLEELGNGVNVVTAGNGRSPDLSLILKARVYASVEVKTPRTLIYPSMPISTSAAQATIEAAVKKARTGKAGQLGSGDGGALAIGGIGLSDTDLNVLESEAQSYLGKAARGQYHRRLLAIAFVGVRNDVSVEPGTLIEVPLGVRWVMHPGYEGVISSGPNDSAVSL
jgi:hypothetical protein